MKNTFVRRCAHSTRRKGSLHSLIYPHFLQMPPKHLDQVCFLRIYFLPPPSSDSALATPTFTWRTFQGDRFTNRGTLSDSILPLPDLRACPSLSSRRSSSRYCNPTLLSNSRGMSVHGLLMLSNPDRRHHHFPDIILRFPRLRLMPANRSS
jgi:hypothetical protein